MYLFSLSNYKVHVACSSAYGFALRKIVESVAVGTIPVTDLPEYDVLPEIDKYLCRARDPSDIQSIRDAIDDAESRWSPSLAREMQEAAISFYDFRDSGLRLSKELQSIASNKA